jgi:CheY-like chemotaxis protein
MPATTEQRSSIRILVVEDNEADVYLIQMALQQSGIHADLTVYSDGETATRHIEGVEEASRPHAIILDLALPRIEGVDLLKSIMGRPALVGVPVLVFTSSPSPADRRRVELLGIARYIQKPNGLDNFLHSVGENVKEMLAESAAAQGNAGPNA